MASVPGKIFLLGEYAVLQGGPAWVAALGPRFSGSVEVAKEWGVPFDAASPAGRYVADLRSSGADPLRFYFQDPHRGRGGFGASTAQFALAYGGVESLAGRKISAAGCWKRYRELTAVAGGVAPSGADLVAQLAGGIQRVVQGRSEDLGKKLLSLWWVAFSAVDIPGRKMATHAHLAHLPAKNFDALSGCVREAEMSLAEGDIGALGGSLTRYARLLSDLGLELQAAREDREVLSRVRGVLGYKGCGAMLADAAVALVTDERAAAKLIEAAEARGLRVVANGLASERGWIA